MLSPQQLKRRNQLLDIPDVSKKYLLGDLHKKQRMLDRRSPGIVKIFVKHVAQKLYAWDVVINDNKSEFDPIVLEGRFPLTRIYGNVYHAYFDVPRGDQVELIVHWNGGHVMLACPGRPWNVYCQVGNDGPA